VTVSPRFRFVLTALLLAVIYYYSLVYLVGWMNAQQRPGWWLSVFPTRKIAALGWVIGVHTFAVLLAALPIAVAAVILARTNAVLLGLAAAVLATGAAVAPALGSAVWPLIWNGHPIFFVTDQAKLIVAVPFLAWVLRAVSSNNRSEPSRS
jgi:hypothetical protein